MCDNLKTIGFDYDGSFAELMEIPDQAFRMNNVIKIDQRVSPNEAALTEPVACVINGQNFLDIKGNDAVFIYGGGFIGCIHAELAYQKGVRKIIIAEISEARRARIKKQLGFVEIFDPTSRDAEEYVKRYTNNRGMDVFITACSVGDTHLTSTNLAARRGRISLFGGIPGNGTGFLDSNAIHYKELSVYGVHASTPAHNALAYKYKYIADGTIGVDKYIEGEFTLAETEKAFAMIIDQNPGKIIIKPS